MIKKNLTKLDLINNLKKQKGFSAQYSKKILNDFLDILKLKISNNNLNLKNIGSFRLINKKSRIGRNPKTKENFIIKARKTVSFKSSNSLLKKINM